MSRVLIVDDSLLIRTLLREILSNAGHEVVGEAEDGLRAPELVRDRRPDLVTLDLVMPGRSGLSTLQHLLQIDSALSVVVCSALLDEERVIAALRIGAKGFIVKPFDQTSVLEAVDRALGPARLLTGTATDDQRISAGARRPTVLIPALADNAIRRVHGICCQLVTELQEILENAIDGGGVTLEQLLALEYKELRGPGIGELSRLFDVGRVSVEGFNPPKFRTAYDTVVDRAMMERMDGILEHEPSLTFALALDLNVYAPAHNSVFSQPYTGDPAEDLRANRTKRFFLDSATLRRAARMELPVRPPPGRLSRREIERLTGPLREPVAHRGENFMVATYQRDTGEMLDTLSVPLYVKAHRWGVVTLGWEPQRL